MNYSEGIMDSESDKWNMSKVEEEQLGKDGFMKQSSTDKSREKCSSWKTNQWPDQSMVHHDTKPCSKDDTRHDKMIKILHSSSSINAVRKSNLGSEIYGYLRLWTLWSVPRVRLIDNCQPATQWHKSTSSSPSPQDINGTLRTTTTNNIRNQSRSAATATKFHAGQ